ncbi:MAG TPA: hypothetical protein ENK12_07745 [Gammaproteobacteria bacterium]|nr:hypothetical protein [Gammaproteobacteria bacterium]
MADLFSVTAPLAIRFPDGRRDILAERMAWRWGLIYLPPFWTLLPVAEALRFVQGPLRGDGPWKAGDAVVTVLGCHGTDAELASCWAEWQDHLHQHPDYPPADTIRELMQTHARRLFA